MITGIVVLSFVSVVLSIFTVVVTVVRIVITSVVLDCIGPTSLPPLEWRLVLVSAYPLSLHSWFPGNTFSW